MLIMEPVHYRGYKIEVHTPFRGNAWLIVTKSDRSVRRWNIPKYWDPITYAKWRVDKALDAHALFHP